MLKEKLIYDDLIPVNVITAEVRNYPIHFHDDLEIAFLLKGSLTLRNGYYTYDMEAGDIFILNDRELHSYFKTDGSNVVALFQIDDDYFKKFFPDLRTSFFVTDMDNPDTDEMERLREVLLRIVMENFSNSADKAQRVTKLTENLIALLTSEFQHFAMENGRFVNLSKSRTNQILAERMNRIQDYLYDNYHKKLTLQEIADREHLSVYYLSHVIKSATGLNFKDFLGFIRIEESEKLLLGSDMKIAAISEAVGFSAVRYYVKYFSRWYGMAPEAYRKKNSGQAGGRELSAEMRTCGRDEVECAIKCLSNTIYRQYAMMAKQQTIYIDFDAKTQADMSGEALRRFVEHNETAMKNAPRLYRMFKDLHGQIKGAGENYLIAQNGTKGFSVLIYYFERLDVGGTQEGDLTAEYIVRFANLDGDYNIHKMNYGRKAILAAARSAVSMRQEVAEREKNKFGNLIDTITSYPAVHTARAQANGSLIFDVAIEGAGGALVLIERA